MRSTEVTEYKVRTGEEGGMGGGRIGGGGGVT